MTGFCTGAGNFPANQAGKQMRVAYDMTDKALKCTWENALTVETLLTNISEK